MKKENQFQTVQFTKQKETASIKSMQINPLTGKEFMTKFIIVIKNEKGVIVPAKIQSSNFDETSKGQELKISELSLQNRSNAIEDAVLLYKKLPKCNIYIIDAKLYIDCYIKYYFNIPLNFLEPYRLMSKKLKPFEVIDKNRFCQIIPILDEMRISLSPREANYLLNHGRSKLINGLFRLSLSENEYGILNLNIHLMKNESPLGRNIIINNQNEKFFVTYDSLLRENVMVPCNLFYFPSKLKGIKLSFRQRRELKKGNSINVNGQFKAQVNAITRSIDIRYLNQC